MTDTAHLRILVASAALAGGLLLSVVSQAGATFPGPNGTIAYVGDSPECPLATEGSPCPRRGVFAADSRGSVLARRGSDPSFSPSGRRLAFSARGGGIATATADGERGSRVRGVAGRQGADPAFSPSGRYLVFRRRGNIYRVRRDGRRLRRLTGAGGSQPAWSSRGRIAFVRGGRIYTMTGEGRDLRRLTGGSFDGDPDWSPHASRLLFTRNGDIHTLAPDGTGLRSHSNSGNSSGPVWSPDGASFAWSSAGDLIVGSSTGVHSDGSGPTGGRVVATEAERPAWQRRP